METDENPLLTAARISGSVKHVFPLDVMVWQPTKLIESYGRGGNFAREVIDEGIVLYEA